MAVQSRPRRPRALALAVIYMLAAGCGDNQTPTRVASDPSPPGMRLITVKPSAVTGARRAEAVMATAPSGDGDMLLLDHGPTSGTGTWPSAPTSSSSPASPAGAHIRAADQISVR